jgi:hypothetical protein
MSGEWGYSWLRRANVFVLMRNLVKHSIPFFVLKRSVGMMFCSSSCRRCLCSSNSRHSDNMCIWVWIIAPHGYDMSSAMLKSL